MGAHHHASPAHRWRLAVAFAITTAVLLAEVAGALLNVWNLLLAPQFGHRYLGVPALVVPFFFSLV